MDDLLVIVIIHKDRSLFQYFQWESWIITTACDKTFGLNYCHNSSESAMWVQQKQREVAGIPPIFCKSALCRIKIDYSPSN